MYKVLWILGIVLVCCGGFMPTWGKLLGGVSEDVHLSPALPTRTIIDQQLYRLGDNKYSQFSENWDGFDTEATMPYVAKKFFVKGVYQNYTLKILSIKGLDTVYANKNPAFYTYSTPTEVYINGMMISQIFKNGTNIEIPIPGNLIIGNTYNNVVIITGHNIRQVANKDYDDIEIQGLELIFK